jgi:predicted transcriptional regulator of viral defense system
VDNKTFEMISDKQKEVLAHLRTVEQADIHEIYRAVSFSYYCNYEKYIGEICSRLVEDGYITRVKRGVFKLGGTKKVIAPNNNSTQGSLF